MKKRLRFLYRYLLRAGSWRYWINTQSLLIVVVSGVFLSVLLISTPRTNDSPPVGPNARTRERVLAVHAEALLVQQTPEADAPSAESAASPTPTRTPFPDEFYENADQTMGITIAGVALVLIVLVGLWSLRPSKDE